jgi:hypothetical protein
MTDDQKLDVIRAHIEAGGESITGTVRDVRYNGRHDGYVIHLEPDGGGPRKKIFVPNERKRELHEAQAELKAAQENTVRALEREERAKANVQRATDEYEERIREAHRNGEDD